MPASSVAISAVPKKELAADNVRLRGRLKKIGVEGKRIGANFGMAAIGAGTATGMGLLMNKWPEAREVMGVETLLVGGAALTLIGVFAKGTMSGASLAVGQGMLFPWLYAYGNTTLAAKFNAA